ncbi:MAG: HYR domain-containing protein, partial [Blastocatellia bacterium]
MNRKLEGMKNESLLWFVSVGLLMAVMLVAAGYSHGTSVTAFEEKQSSTQVHIEVAPGVADVGAKLTTPRNVSVTIFSSSSFDATTMIPAGISFRDAVSLEGSVGANKVSVKDVNQDGYPDLVAEFSVQRITEGPTKMILEGKTAGGTLIQGTACVQASGVPCGGTMLGPASQVDQGESAAPAGPEGAVDCTESFDGVTAPALPVNWTAATAIDCATSDPWATSNAGTPTPAADTAPNAAFVNDPNCISDERLDSPNFLIVSATAVMTFRHNRNLESGFDGTVLEVSINGGAFQDILAASATFGTNGYNGTISVNFGSPIGGRQAWTGNSGGVFVTTTVNLPASANGQSWRFRWRRGADSSVAVQGFRLDTLSIAGSDCSGVCSSITCPANVTQGNDTNQCGAVVNYPAPTPNGTCGTITCAPASGSFFPVGTTTVTCTSSVGPTCAFTVTVNDTQPPTITCPANITVSNDPNQCGAVVNYPPPTVSDNCPGVGAPVCAPAS